MEVAPGSGAVPAALSAQVEGVDVSEDQRQKQGWSRMLTMLTDSAASPARNMVVENVPNAGTKRGRRKHSEATVPV